MLNQSLSFLNGIIWHPWVILTLLGVGILYTILTKCSQYRSLTHGIGVVMGRYDNPNDPGTISHFQALSAALSATVGVGNIGGTALAIAAGGPGAIFWMWIVGILGMALKTMEVSISMLFRTTMDEQPRGGPMWVVENGSKDQARWLRPFARFLASLFCVTLLIATFTGGLFFQAWNASNVTQKFFGVSAFHVGIVLAIIVGLVILGGIKRIGVVASRIVPLMCGVYLLAGIYVLTLSAGEVPRLLLTIVTSAFSSSDAQGAFMGGTMGAVFSIGMQQAFFSNEAGQGSSSIVHSAVKTDEPIREGVVAGLEPFIDTIVVCTLTGLVILSSGVWNRGPDFEFTSIPDVVRVDTGWQLEETPLPQRHDRDWVSGDQVYCIVRSRPQGATEDALVQAVGSANVKNQSKTIQWNPIDSERKPVLTGNGLYEMYAGASLTALAFDAAHPGLGRWLVTLATWLFGISTMISWCYYGEQGVLYLMGPRLVIPYRILFCLGIVISCAGIVQSRAELTQLANLGTGVMLWVNIPITLLFAGYAVRKFDNYFKRMGDEPTGESN